MAHAGSGQVDVTIISRRLLAAEAERFVLTLQEPINQITPKPEAEVKY